MKFRGSVVIREEGWRGRGVCKSDDVTDAQSWLKNHTNQLGTPINNSVTERSGGFRASSEMAQAEVADIYTHVTFWSYPTTEKTSLMDSVFGNDLFSL